MVEFIENHPKTFKIKLKIPKSENHEEQEDKKLVGGDNLDYHHKKIQRSDHKVLASKLTSSLIIKSTEKVCQVCNKVFGSGKALGGHMRIHFQAYKNKDQIFEEKNKKILKTQHSIKLKKNTNKCGVVEPTCALCGKIFPSMKSLFGHMRSHSESERRGLLRPPSPVKTLNFSSSTSSTSELVDDNKEVFAPRNLLDVFPKWSVTAKRGRKATNRVVDDVVEDEFREAVDDLMMFANGEDQEHQKVESFEVSNDEGLIIKNKERKNMKLRGLDQIQDSFSHEKHYKCTICGKCFPTHQALGGHKSSHHKFRMFNQNSIDDDHHYSLPRSVDTESLATKMKMVKKTKEKDERVGTQQQYICKVSNKISHYSSGQGIGEVLDFDLNELPPVGEDIDDEAHYHTCSYDFASSIIYNN